MKYGKGVCGVDNTAHSVYGAASLEQCRLLKQKCRGTYQLYVYVARIDHVFHTDDMRYALCHRSRGRRHCEVSSPQGVTSDRPGVAEGRCWIDNVAWVGRFRHTLLCTSLLEV